MVEVEDCRYCGSCCSRDWEIYDMNGCLFLDFSEKDSKFSCLIYKNKARLPLWSAAIEGFFEDLSQHSSERYLEFRLEMQKKLFDKLTNMATYRDVGSCDLSVCDKKREYGKLEIDTRTSKEWLKHATLFQKHVEQVREMIPNFHDLVDILNRNIDGYCIFEDESTGQKPKEQ